MDLKSDNELRASLSRVSFQARWEVLKPTIKRLYIDEGRRLADVAEILKKNFGFDALEDGYKYYINKKWKLRKNIPASKKSAILEVLQTRESTSVAPVVKYKGAVVDPKKLRRHHKLITRNQVTMRTVGRVSTQEPVFAQYTIHPSVSGIFLSWNVPHGPFPRLETSTPSPYPPAATSPSSLSDVDVISASDHDIASPMNNHSELVVALSQKKAMERAHLFWQGEVHDLLKVMKPRERRIMSTWLYQYWQFAYRTAKNWGHSPENSTAALVNFKRTQDTPFIPLPGCTNRSMKQRAKSVFIPNVASGANPAHTSPIPSSLCRWTIHKDPELDDEDDSLSDEIPSNIRNAAPRFREKLRDALETNDFSNIEASSLPVALPQVLKAVRRSPQLFFAETFGFAIMGRHDNLVYSCCLELKRKSLDIAGLFPYHLATSYLDGSRTCCNILNTLLIFMPVHRLNKRNFINDLGHTVLDNLMITILRSHTTLTPKEIDNNWDQDTRFVGEEVDVCGRWDADSDCVRQLYARGQTTIPSSWKHKFCHTSAQTVCHCINAIFTAVTANPDINTTSGLFLKYCSCCGKKMQLYPLHSCVLTAYYLARRGSQGEDLLGIIACLLCLLKNGANPLRAVEVSLSALYITDDCSQCDHTQMDPLNLAETLQSLFSTVWSAEISIGWQLFCYALRSSVVEWKSVLKIAGAHHRGQCLSERTHYYETLRLGRDFTNDDLKFLEYVGPSCFASCCHGREIPNYFGTNSLLGDLWAAVQTEFLTYRPQEEGDRWTSVNFNMQNLLWSLNTYHRLNINLVQNEMMNPFCKCGTFGGVTGLCATAEDACAFDFSNLENEGDDCSRATYINMPDP